MNRLCVPALSIVVTPSRGGSNVMEIRKVFRAGNSFAVSIPADWVREMHLEDQPVQVRRNEQGEIVFVQCRYQVPTYLPSSMRQ